MNDFFNSKFVQDLKGGKLPAVEVKFSAESLVQLGVTLVLAAVIIMIVAAITQKLKSA